MSSYRDDTQETMVASDSVFTKVRSDVVEILKITDAQSAKIKVQMLETFSIFDEVQSTKVGLFDDYANIYDEVSDKKNSQHLIEDSVKIGDSTRSVFRVVNPSLDFINIHDELKHHLKVLTFDNIYIADNVSTKLSARSIISEKVKIVDTVTTNNKVSELISDTILVTEHGSYKLRAAQSESFFINDSIQHKLITKGVFEDTLKINDSLNRLIKDSILEQIAIKDSLPLGSIFKDLINDQISVTTGFVDQRKVQDDINEVLTVQSHAIGKLQAYQFINDLVFIDEVFPLEDATGNAWSAGCDAWNMSRYVDFNYSQLAVINDELFAITESGVHKLVEGVQEIQAKIITPKLDLGEGALIHPLAMYLEYSLAGNNKKINVGVNTTQDGNSATYTYMVPNENSNYLTNGRAVFGRGLRGRHFSFIVSLTGQQGHIKDMNIDIAQTKRRI